MKTWQAAIVSTCALMAGLAPAHATQPYPTKPLTLVIGFPPGGGADNVARVYANHLSTVLKQPVVVENRPGAGSTIGAATVARAAPDGYTLYLGNSSVMGSDNVLYDVSYKPENFAPVAQLTTSPMILIASKASGIASVKDLLERARAKPDSINFASSGNGVITHLAGVEFMNRSQTRLMHIPFKGGAPATQSVAAGDTDISFATAPSARAALETGRTVALGITSGRPSSLMPQYPTIAEQGVPDYDISNWWGIFVPAGTPDDVIQTLFKATNVVLANDEVKKSMASNYEEVTPSESVEAFTAFARREGQLGLSLAQESRATAN